MRVLASLLVAGLALAGCKEQASDTAGPVITQPRSLQFFKENAKARNDVLKACAATQGSHAYQPEIECDTAMTAQEQNAREGYIAERNGK